MPTIVRHCWCWLLAIGLLAPGASSGSEWTVEWQLDRGALSAWGIASAGGKIADRARPQRQSWRWQGATASALRGVDGTLELRLGSRQLRLPQLRLQIEGDGQWLRFSDRAGRVYLWGEFAHRHRHRHQQEWRHLNLLAGPALAEAFALPALRDQWLGEGRVVGPRDHGLDKGSRNCRSETLWPSAEQPADLQLIDIGRVSVMRCLGCSADSTDGRLALAPNARLLNVGSRDIPWWSKFTAPMPPYGNDQHPFLVWNIYRSDADGRVVPLAASGVKHAFFSTNDFCDCAGDNVLYRQCSDLYAAATNDDPRALGPRSEILPRPGLWGRCGSIFDPDCDGQPNALAGDDGQRARALVSEAELRADLHPGARWWVEAWYVVRDDGVLENNFAHQEFLPAKGPTGAWTTTVTGAVHDGPLLLGKARPPELGEQFGRLRLTLERGRIDVFSSARALAGGGYRYRYSLLNLDFADASRSGIEPNLRLTSPGGLGGLQLAAAATVQAVDWRDGDDDASNDWSAQLAANSLQFMPAGGDLHWGRLGSLQFESAAAPVCGEVRLTAAGSLLPLRVWRPRPVEQIFADGAEAPCQ